MDRFERYALLSTLMRELKASGSWCGETHVQKAAYLAQELMGVPLGFDFVLYKHGPYSFDLRDEITAMRADNLVRLDPQSFPYGPTLQTTELAGRIEEGYRQTVQENETLLRFVAQEFGKKGVAELERLTTAFYVTREMERGASLDDRAIRLNRLKPHVSLDEAQNAVRAADELIEKASALAA